MFKDFLTSFVIVPLLLGLIASRVKDPVRARSALRIGWVAYAALWFAVLYYLRYRWT